MPEAEFFTFEEHLDRYLLLARRALPKLDYRSQERPDAAPRRWLRAVVILGGRRLDVANMPGAGAAASR